MNGEVGIVAQFEVETPTLNMLELIEFRSDDQLISDIHNTFTEFDLGVYPNPTSDFLIVTGHSELTNTELMLFDINGSVLFKDIFSKELKINTSNLPGGQYVLSVVSKDGFVWTRKIVIL